MNSKYIMMASSIFLGLLGILASFLPNELLENIGVSPIGALTLFIQIGGAIYFGFAIMNWMAKTVLIGGIYARPLVMGNFTHFVVAAIALIKATINHATSDYVWVAAIVYSIFAILFSIILFSTPTKR